VAGRLTIGVKALTRLLLSLGVAAVVAVLATLALTVVDLYLVGHGRASLNREVVSIPGAGIHLSPSDVLLLVGTLASGFSAWFLLRRAA
jgi:hypothetical protein